MEQKIIQVMRTVREGVSKKTNKPYQILLVMVEDGSEIEVFGPAKKGDIVTEITHNEQYDKLQGRVVKSDKFEEVLKGIEEIKAGLKYLSDKFDKFSGSQGPDVARPTLDAPVRRLETPLSSPPVRQPAPIPESATPTTSTELQDKLKTWQRPSEPAPTDEDMPDFFINEHEGDPRNV